jgi:hypothetical protein
MPWVESVSPSFSARHHSSATAEAERLLDQLERTREHLAALFPTTVGELTVVLHSSPASLRASNPLLLVRRAACAPSARRYIAGWSGRSELHILDERSLARRASRVPGSLEMLRLTAAALYARRVVEECNPDVPRGAPGFRRLAVELRWCWLLEGAARYFVGQTAHARAAIARRLREGPAPAFPPHLRDAILLGGTIFDLLEREAGTGAAVRLACHLDPRGPRAALSGAFAGRALVHTEGAWRAHLARLAGATR